ncbi:two-component system, response regulator YesN [Paenibacillus polysaccharolyticus]|uniref:Two-component system, response regulator YesN n=1 Tax=Paenibacillus polysaccharolyticus TaxID=582692 RepID=A0A1G5HSN5_9BACL|nr:MULTISPECIES: response regulator transcription factor [Paenibacillus]SCY66763.1 two-component system, response regulator YesN [Paenibacillus polysaccharolyticus]
MYKVFIVDDEPFIIEGLYDIVDWSSFGMEIVNHAGNGQAALQALPDQPVDILITDISMPLMNGLDLIQEARQLQPELKVIILSGFNEFEYLKEGMKLGIENYLLKPINVDELQSTLRNTATKLDQLVTPRLEETYGIQMLKDNILHRWLTGQIAAAEFEERARFMNLSLDAPCIAVAVLRDKTQAHKAAMLFAQVEQLAVDYSGLNIFQDMNGDIVLVANIEDEPDEKDRLMLGLQELADRLAVRYPDLHIGAGRLVKGLYQAPVSYEEAKKALQYVMIYPERRVIDHVMLDQQGHAALSFFIDWRAYAKLILSRSTEQLAGRIRTDFEQHRHELTPEQLQNTALEMVIRFKMELEGIRHAEETVIYQQGLRLVLDSTTLDELVHALQQVAARTIESLLQDMRNPIVNQVLQHIDNHYAEELSLKLLGAQYHLHPVYLGQLFHKETGETFAEYINKYRIERAKEQLRSSNLKVHEIARNVGYWETGYFYKQFRKYVGISPTDYKVFG